MKKYLFLLLFFSTIVQHTIAQETQILKEKYNKAKNDTYFKTTGYVSSQDYFDSLKKWKVLEGSEWNLTILYENSSKGEMTLTSLREPPIYLSCVLNGFEQINVQFKIEISREDDDSLSLQNKWKHVYKYSQVRVLIKSIENNTSSYSNDDLKTIKQELYAILQTGTDFEIDDVFFNDMQRLEDDLNTKKALSEDKTLSRREHKNAVKEYDNLKIRFTVYKEIVSSATSDILLFDIGMHKNSNAC